MDETTVAPDDQPADEPAAVLARFAPGWPAYLACGPGWYPLVERLDRELARIDPGYTVMQVKEKFGGLRYYAEVSDASGLACCERLVTELGPEAQADSTAVWDDHCATDEHVRLEADRERRSRALQATVRQGEAESFTVCEVTGGPGVLMRRGSWLRTLDPAAAEDGWELVQESDQ